MAHIEGLRELSLQLAALGGRVGARTLRKAARRAVNPTVRIIRQRAPVKRTGGWTRSYKGRPLPPGFLKRSVRTRSRIDRRRGAVYVTIGVLAEAFYGINFLDLGPIHVTRRNKKPIKPYTLRRRPWMTDTFIADRSNIEKRFRDELRNEIRKVTHGK